MDPAVDGNLETWTLSAEEHELSNARSDANRLDFALLLKFFQSAGRFQTETSTIGPRSLRTSPNSSASTPALSAR